MGRKNHLRGIEKAKMIKFKALDIPNLQIAKLVDRSHQSVDRVVNSNLKEIGQNRAEFLIKLREAGIDYDYFIAKCKELLDCKRRIYTSKGSPVDVPDNNIQSKVMYMIKDIIGLDAPKEIKQDISLKLDDKEAQEISLIKKRYALINN